jgi:hypothetical protein
MKQQQHNNTTMQQQYNNIDTTVQYNKIDTTTQPQQHNNNTTSAIHRYSNTTTTQTTIQQTNTATHTPTHPNWPFVSAAVESSPHSSPTPPASHTHTHAMIGYVRLRVTLVCAVRAVVSGLQRRICMERERERDIIGWCVDFENFWFC